MTLSLKQIAGWLNLPLPNEVEITGVSIDTRTLKPGHLFVALQGTQSDGHTFIPEAINQGAAAILCVQPQQALSVPVLIYPDAEKALALMATAHRAQLDCQVVALTGSNGKTTVKEMLAAILPEATFATPGNWNNHLGVPLSVLQVNDSHQYAVFELGANHVGEIAYTTAIVKPHVALVNNIGTAHIEGFGSVEGIARGKGEIYQGLSQGGIAVINADDKYAHFWDNSLVDKQILRFSATDAGADIYAADIKVAHATEGVSFRLVRGADACDVTLQVPGMHHVYNALAAASCAVALGLELDEIARGLVRFSGVSGRLTPQKTSMGAMVLDDTYNANLNSVLAGIDVLASYPGKRILVLGDMGELGEYTQAHHEAVAEAAKQAGIDVLLTCGVASEAAAKTFGDPAQHFGSQAALLEILKSELDAKTTVLVKGSRSSAMEQVVEALFA
ncbi:MAG: UDP-N-acetylmuramoyl-tripeptide--D-alanyl-D-alanine ligase [Legionellaceae bacterium]|nr:UDP-N-acetylmuramoyl-tripeptide--D-alanyl-D-alanine ligase [Legionellaceae bacterium]